MHKTASVKGEGLWEQKTYNSQHVTACCACAYVVPMFRLITERLLLTLRIWVAALKQIVDLKGLTIASHGNVAGGGLF